MHILRQRRWKVLRQVATAVGVGTGLAALYRHLPASIGTGHVGGRSIYRGLEPRGGPSGAFAEEQGSTARTL